MRIAIASAKGGVGKTTIAANLGVVLSNVFDKKTLAVDTNFSTSSLSLHFDTSKSPPMTDVLKGKAKLSKAIYKHESGLDVLHLPVGPEPYSLSRAQFESILRKVDDDYDYILLDSAPGICEESSIPIGCSDKVLLVTAPDMPSLAGIMRTIQRVKSAKKRMLGIVINRRIGYGHEAKIDEIKSLTGLNVLCEVPEDPRVEKYITLQDPISFNKPKSLFARRMVNLASIISGEDNSTFLTRILGFFRLNVDNESHVDLKQSERVDSLKQELKKEILAELRTHKSRKKRRK